MNRNENGETMKLENLSIIRKYFVEFVVSMQMVAIGFLFKIVINLNDKIVTIQTTQIEKSNEALYNSTNATNQFLNFQRFYNDKK